MKFYSLQSMRAFAALLVVVAHLAIIESKYGGGFVWLPKAMAFAGAAGVHCFFVISGCVMALLAGRASWQGFAISRITRIYPIYWVYTTAALVVFLAAPFAVNAAYLHPPSIWKSYLLVPDDVGPLLAVGWTLVLEVYFYAVVTLIIACRAPLLPSLCVWAAVVLLVPLVAPPGGPVLGTMLSPLTLEFIAGGFVGLALMRWNGAFARPVFALGVIALAAGWTVFLAAGYGIEREWLSILLLGAPFVPVIYGAAALERQGRWPRLPALEHLGDASYSLYLCHVLVLSALGRAFQRLAIHGWTAECVFVLVGLLAVCVVAVASYRWMELPLIALSRKMLAANR